jgi:MFS family permease
MHATPETTSETNASYAGWPVVASAVMGVMVGYAVLVPYTFSIFLKPLCASFGWRRDQVAIAFACVAITVAICAPVTGWLLDRFGPRLTILPCTVLFGGVFASLSLLTPSLTRFYVTFVLLGLAANGTTQLAYSRAVSSWFFARRGMALALVSAGAGVGSMVLPLLTAWLIAQYGWRAAYRDLGLLVIVFSLPLATIFLRERTSGTQYVIAGHKRDTFVSAVWTREYLLLVSAIFLYSISFNGVISHFAPLLTDRGISLHVAAEALAVIGVSGFFGRLVTGYLLDRFFAPYVSLIFFLTTVVAMTLLCFQPTAAAFAGAALLGFAAGGESDITPYLISRYFGLSSFSSLYGVAWTAFATGTAVGPLLMGRLYIFAGSYKPSGIELLATPALASAGLMTRMPPYSDRPGNKLGPASTLIAAREPSLSDM